MNRPAAGIFLVGLCSTIAWGNIAVVTTVGGAPVETVERELRLWDVSLDLFREHTPKAGGPKEWESLLSYQVRNPTKRRVSRVVGVFLPGFRIQANERFQLKQITFRGGEVIGMPLVSRMAAGGRTVRMPVVLVTLSLGPGERRSLECRVREARDPWREGPGSEEYCFVPLQLLGKWSLPPQAMKASVMDRLTQGQSDGWLIGPKGSSSRPAGKGMVTRRWQWKKALPAEDLLIARAKGGKP